MKKTTSCGICLWKKNNKTKEIEILLRKPALGKFWGFVKGSMEKKETIKDTAIREFKEETLNQLEFDENIQDCYSFFQENDRKDIFIYLVPYLDNKNNNSKFNKFNELIKIDKEENEIIKFFSINQLPEIFFNQSLIIEEMLDYFKYSQSDEEILKSSFLN